MFLKKLYARPTNYSSSEPQQADLFRPRMLDVTNALYKLTLRNVVALKAV